MRRIISWLADTEPSKEHILASEKHVHNTGSWLTSSDEFSDWMSTSKSIYWLNGGGESGRATNSKF